MILSLIILLRILFLSPELSSSSDYGGAAIDYNIKDPNPVVVSAELVPCYKTASISVE
jgi:hypothetical protein